jgi:hypothetical protein
VAHTGQARKAAATAKDGKILAIARLLVIKTRLLEISFLFSSPIRDREAGPLTNS